MFNPMDFINAEICTKRMNTVAWQPQNKKNSRDHVTPRFSRWGLGNLKKMPAARCSLNTRQVPFGADHSFA